MVLDDPSSSRTTLDPSKETSTWDSSDLSSRYASVFPLKINREHLQRPNPFVLWVGFAGPWNWERTVMYRLSQQVETVKGLLRRDLSQTELDALTEHASREMNTRRIGLPVGVTAGSVHAYYTLRRRLNMPSNVSFFESFRTAWRLAAVQERRSAAFAAGLRLGAWMFFMAGNFGGYATYKFTVALTSDPRLADFREAVKRYAEARAQRLEGYKEKAKQRREGIDAVRHAGATSSAEEAGEEYKGVEGQSVGTYGQAEERGQSDAPPYQTYQTPSRGYETPRSYTDSSSGSSDFFDDASPTAPEYQTPVTTSKPSSNENAWDRIRRENASRASISAPSSQSSWGRPQQQMTSSEYSSYDSEQQSGQRERESAQRDFDRMLDAERQVSQQDAGDESNSNKKGWRRW
ncbi:endo-1,3(4)-beta-glucanase [Talaromyces pinophilus]|uniref:Endo-1,3(4)-beta-glucanase n=1 Tax=Talaromyces pinophilus TaxID=128442 RepID=A0A6V8H1X9_TALPI|nr:endo-1,3(4)-beta-glucanase [Talaromyces pinophilus]